MLDTSVVLSTVNPTATFGGKPKSIVGSYSIARVLTQLRDLGATKKCP